MLITRLMFGNLMVCPMLGIQAQWCDEFLVHAADVEGLCQGIDEVRG